MVFTLRLAYTWWVSVFWEWYSSKTHVDTEAKQTLENRFAYTKEASDNDTKIVISTPHCTWVSELPCTVVYTVTGTVSKPPISLQVGVPPGFQSPLES